MFSVLFFIRIKIEFWGCFDEACTASTQYTQRLPSSKIYPLSVAVGGFARKTRKAHGLRDYAYGYHAFLYNKGNLCVCFDENVVYRTKYAYAPFSSKISPFSVAVGGFA